MQISYHTHSLISEKFCNDSKDRRTKGNMMKGTTVLWTQCPPTPQLPFPSMGLELAATGWDRLGHEPHGTKWQGKHWCFLRESLCHGKHPVSESLWAQSKLNPAIKRPLPSSNVNLVHIFPVPVKWAHCLWYGTSHMLDGDQRKISKTITTSLGGRRPFPSVYRWGMRYRRDHQPTATPESCRVAEPRDITSWARLPALIRENVVCKAITGHSGWRWLIHSAHGCGSETSMFLETGHVTGHSWEASGICLLSNSLALGASNILKSFGFNEAIPWLWQCEKTQAFHLFTAYLHSRLSS